jgi:hypothetical protein
VNVCKSQTSLDSNFLLFLSEAKNGSLESIEAILASRSPFGVEGSHAPSGTGRYMEGMGSSTRQETDVEEVAVVKAVQKK